MGATLVLLRFARSNMLSNTLLSNTRHQATSIPEISELEKIFPVSIDRELEPLFKESPHLISAIQKAVEIAHRHFNGEKLFVGTIKDPESSELDKLSIIVETSLDSATVFEKTSAVNKEFLKQNNLRDIPIHVEFQR